MNKEWLVQKITDELLYLDRETLEAVLIAISNLVKEGTNGKRKND